MKKNLVRNFLGLVTLVVCFLIVNSPISARQISLRSNRSLENLSKKIALLSGDGQKGDSGARAKMERLAIERFAALLESVKSDPAEVDRAALPANLLAKIPADLQQYFEKREDVEGELEVIAECDETNGRTLYFLKTASGRLSLNFANEPDANFSTGMQVRVGGVRVGNSMVTSTDSLTSLQVTEKASSASVQTMTTSAALPNTFGEHKVLVILVNFQDLQTQPYTTAQAQDVTFNTVSNFYRENSYGQTWLTGDVYGWYTIPVSSTSCDTASIATYAQQAASNAGANLSAYDHYVYAFPRTMACAFSGRSSVGGSPSESWINTNSIGLTVLAHELGHGFGLLHSRSMDCGANVIGGSCTIDEYGDSFDDMGATEGAHFNSYQKERLGWLNYGGSPPLQTVTASGTYWIDNYETTGSSAKALKILKSTDPTTGNKTWYYLEHRSATGFDNYLSYYGVQNGVVVHTGSEGNGADTYLLDMTPATMNWYDSPLAAGQSFTDSNAGVTITTLSADGTGALVQIDVASQPCAHANPSVTVSPGQTQWLNSGTTFNYTVSVTNNDGSGCAAGNFKLQANVGAGWSAVYSTPSLSLTPGGNSTAMLSVTSPVGTSDGNYGVSSAAVNGSNSSYSGTASASYEIVTGLGMATSSGAASYSRTQKATVTTVVTAAGIPVSGAGVSFMMTKSNGQTVAQTATTDATGKAVFTYSFNRRTDPLGTYSVSATAGYSGLSGKGSTTFYVKK